MRFLTDYYRAFSPVIAAVTLLAVLCFCAIDFTLRGRRTRRAELAALATAWAIGVIAAFAYGAVQGATAETTVSFLIPVGVSVLLPLAIAAPVYQSLASKNATAAVGVAAIVSIATNPFGMFIGFFAGCLTGVRCFRL